MRDLKTPREQRIRRMTQLYYSRPDIKKAIFDFSKNREVVPSYMMEGFGKRPDTMQYPGDIFELVKRGATSFHCSEELWEDPLKISTDLNEKQMNELRKGWDLLLDIDSKYLDYSKIMVQQIIRVFKFHNIKNFKIKFSVSGDTPVMIRLNRKIKLLSISEIIFLLKSGKQLEVLSLDKNKKLKFSKVYDFLEHKDIIYEIKHSQSTIPLKVTEHHSVFVWNKGDTIQKKVSELKKGDFLISFNSKKNPFSKKNLNTFNKFEFGKNKVIRRIKITPELMRLIGYFLAEGHVTNIINQVGFTFNKNEEEYIKDVKNLLFLITKRRISTRHPNPNSTQILIHSKEWANFFDNFCGKKKSKHVPEFSWKLPRNLFLEMLKGYIRGDGYKLGEYGMVVKSVSKTLITEFIWLCKLNNISCNLSWEKNKPHKLPQGTLFEGSLVYMLRIPKSELKIIEFHRKRNKFSLYAGDKIFPVDGLKLVYKQIKPKMFNSHRVEQMVLKKKKANLSRIKKVLDWFYNFKELELNEESQKILSNYEKLFNSDISVVEIKEITKKKKSLVYDISVEGTEAFFGNYSPILLHNSGSKGFHIIIPWKAFPKEINEVKASDMFPEWPRIITKYITEITEKELIEKTSSLTKPSKYVRDFQVPKEVMPDLILVSPRHLFRMPYSLHEKTALASVVLDPEEIENFQPRDADPLKAKPRDFMPDPEEGEASELLREALDWYKNKYPEEEKEKRRFDFKPVKLTDLSEKYFPPSIQEILQGIKGDGRKRALFVLMNLFRSIGMEKEELEKRTYAWNEKNEVPLKTGYIKSQLISSYRRKPILPPNYDKDYYRGIGVAPTEEEIRYKNPVNYMIKKSLQENRAKRPKKSKKKK